MTVILMLTLFNLTVSCAIQHFIQLAIKDNLLFRVRGSSYVLTASQQRIPLKTDTICYT